MGFENVTTNFKYTGLRETGCTCVRRYFWLSRIAIHHVGIFESTICFQKNGTTPYFLTARNYKAAGTIRLLFDCTQLAARHLTCLIVHS